MKVLLLIPCDPEAARGNATTAKRLKNELWRRGYEVTLADITKLDLEGTAEISAQLVIGLHAVHCGPAAQSLAKALGVPYIVLLSGTDLNGQPQKPALDAVAQATAVVALGNAPATRARDIYPECRNHLHVIPQAVMPLPYRPGINLPDDAPELPADAPLILVPAGVREVKDPVRAITALIPLHKERPDMQLWFVGPELEKETGDALRAACVEHDWAHWLQQRPREDLLPLFRRATAVLSTSRSEGGPPNGLLEAVLVGRPVLASSIPAHREFPGAESCFRDDAELRKRFRAILAEPERAMMKSRKMEEIVRQKHSPAAESLGWDRLMRPLID
ncbi:MAG: glycosyltransferase family 4 protein [Planctomycetota bacterium]